MPPIRILHILTSLNRGGIETMLMNYYRAIDRTKVQFDFLLHRDGIFDYSKEIESMGGRIYSVPKYNPLSIKYIKSLYAFFEEHRDEYHVVHCHLNCISALPLAVAKKCSIPVRIAHSHIIIKKHDLKSMYKRLSRKFIPLFATDFFACSEEAGRWMFGSRNMSVMPNAIDTSSFIFDKELRQKTRKELGLDQELVIGNVGRLTEQKNQSFLIILLKELLSREKNVKLVLIGDGEDKQKLEVLVSNNNLKENVLFVGSTPNVNAYMQAFDVFAFPSIYEGLGIVAVEAQTAGLFTICSKNVPHEVKLTENCIFLDLNDMDSWIEKILLGSKKERGSLRDDDEIAKFDINKAVIKYQEYYLNAFHDSNYRLKGLYD